VTLDELMRRADFVSINCPLDGTTRGMIGAKQFALMQPHAFFITTARGFIHDERALEAALRDKADRGRRGRRLDKGPPPASHRCSSSTTWWRARTRRRDARGACQQGHSSPPSSWS